MVTSTVGFKLVENGETLSVYNYWTVDFCDLASMKCGA